MKKCNVGMVTFHRAENYGAILQSYALYSMINKIFNSDCAEVIDYRSSVVEKPYNLIYLGNDNKKIYNFLKSLVLLKKNFIKKRNFRNFRNENLKMSKPIFSSNAFFEMLNNYDYVITGSDQVWNLDITMCDYNIYLLNSGELRGNYKKISYAPSIGADLKNDEHYNIIAKSIGDFKSVSVREKLAKDNLIEFSKKNIDVCLDPVLLHDSKFWINISKKSGIKQDYIFIYTIDLDENMINFADKLATEKNLLIVHVDKKSRYKSKSKSMYHCGPDIFIDLIANSKYVLTNSFHGLAFSIIFEKNFVVFPKKGRNSRIENLLDVCGLNNRIYLNDFNIDDYIDYKKVFTGLNKDRKKSLDFLYNALDKRKNI